MNYLITYKYADYSGTEVEKGEGHYVKRSGLSSSELDQIVAQLSREHGQITLTGIFPFIAD